MDKSEIETILGNWDVGELVSHKRARKGVVNIDWILRTTPGKYVLRKIANFTNVDDLEFGANYLAYLKEHSFPYQIPVPIKTKSKESFLNFEGSCFWVYAYIEGRDIKRFGCSELRECARMMATYHDLIENSGLDNKKGFEVFRRESVLKESSILIPLLKSLDGLEYSRLSRYPLHRDVNPENTLWKDRKLVGLIDFENMSTINDTMIKDISAMLQYSRRDITQKHRLDLRLAKFLLTEYRKYR